MATPKSGQTADTVPPRKSTAPSPQPSPPPAADALADVAPADDAAAKPAGAHEMLKRAAQRAERTFFSAPPDGPQSGAPQSGASQDGSPAATAPAAAAPSTAPEWSMSPSAVDFDHPLLTSLALLTAILHRPMSTQALLAGLPSGAKQFTPESCVRAAERAGLKARIARRDKLSAIPSVALPCILLLRGGSACVLLGFVDDGRVKLALPEAAGGTEIVPLGPLQAQYAGYAIFAKPQFQFDARAGDLRPRAGPQWFWGTLARFRPIYGHVVMASVVINLLALASPLFVMNVYDRVVPNAAMETLWALVFGVLIVVIFEFAIRVLRSYFVDLAGKNADVIIANDLLRQIMGLRLGAAPPSTGALINTLREFESVREFFTSGSLVALVDLPFVLLFVGIVAAIGGPLALVPLIAIPLVMGVGYALQFPLIRLVQESYREAAQKNALLVEAIEGLDAVKTCGGEGRVLALWEQLVGRTAETARQARLIATLSTTASLTIVQLSGIAVVVWGAYRIADGDMTMGSLVACTILVGRSLAPLGAMAAMLTRLQQSRVALAGLDALMQAPTERPVEKSFVARPRLNGDLEFRQVSFRYPGQQQAALDAVSFRLMAGERLGIIGRVGSGKSTIARLILGLYEPTAGTILVDGVDIRQVDPIDLRRNIGSVGQDSVLFFGSVRDNIAYGAPHVDDATVERAARLAGVSEFVRTHPRGYDLPVGERGTALSGGQRQSIAIARALLLDPPVLLLDEPTSSLDNSAEATLKRRLADIAPGKTMVLITHRSSLLPLVDRLLIMDGGKIVADGPRDEVLLALRDGQVRATAWA